MSMSEAKYKQIADELVRRMRSGAMADRLPSQRALAAEFGVSSRTLHKVFLVLKRQNCIAPSPRGTTVAGVPPEPPRKNRIDVFIPRDEKVPPGDPLYLRLTERIAAAGFDLRLRSTRNLTAETLAADDFLPGDGCIFPYSTFRLEYAAPLRRRDVPFVVGNRVAAEAGVHWVDWNHLDLFDNIVGELVARGAREIGLFCPGLDALRFSGNLQAIHQDFIAAKRGYFLFNRELDALPPEEYSDPQTYLAFLRTLPHRPDVILCLNPLLRRQLVAGLATSGDEEAEARVLLLNSASDEEQGNCVVGFYSDAGYRKIADKLWTLFRQAAADPGLKPCGLKQRCTIQYSKSFLKTKFLPTKGVRP